MQNQGGRSREVVRLSFESYKPVAVLINKHLLAQKTVSHGSSGMYKGENSFYRSYVPIYACSDIRIRASDRLPSALKRSQSVTRVGCFTRGGYIYNNLTYEK